MTEITEEDIERVKLLQIVSKKGLNELGLKQLIKLQELVEKKIIVTTKRLIDLK